jgi:hypothetical protein
MSVDQITALVVAVTALLAALRALVQVVRTKSSVRAAHRRIDSFERRWSDLVPDSSGAGGSEKTRK